MSGPGGASGDRPQTSGLPPNHEPGWRNLLMPLSWLFAALVKTRNALFDWGLRKRARLPRPVISVGNLAMGGTGKSPICNDLLTRLTEMNLNVCLLSRGYGREQKESSRVVTPDTTWLLAGVEPLMLARNHPKASICVGPTRAEAAAAHPFPPDIYLVDDGFQHRQLARDLDMVLIDIRQGKPRWFPVKNFRETLAALKRADLAVLTRWKGEDTTDWDRRIAAVNPNLPILRARFRPGLLRKLDGSRDWPLADLQGQPVAAYTGIAKPDQFFETLTDLGANLVYTLPLADHEPLSPEKLEHLRTACRDSGAAWLITTEKDAVKLDKNGDFDIVVAYLTLEVVWDDPSELQSHLTRLTAYKDT